MTIDPICKMKIDRDEAITLEFSGKKYYFCSEGCRDKFLSEHPEKGERRHYELIIIGGGPAGLTAAVYASMLKINTIIITKDIGGQAYDSIKIENYMGYDFITGPELVKKFQYQLIHSHYVDHKIAEVERVEAKREIFDVITGESEHYKAETLIIATGMTRRKLEIPGEEKFQRKGVFYGNIQDYSFVQGANVGVIGGGNSALQIVEKLNKIAKNIYLITDFELTADHVLIERIKRLKNLKIYENTKVLEFEGEKVLSGLKIRIKDSGEIIQIPVFGVFISIGMHPNSALVARLVKLNDRREIIINKDCSTSHPGIFAAGDVTDAFGKRIIIASGEGAKAALAARKYILEYRNKPRRTT